jgi:hypothetical protein
MRLADFRLSSAFDGFLQKLGHWSLLWVNRMSMPFAGKGNKYSIVLLDVHITT